MNKKRGLAGWLIQHAAHSAPPMLAERLEEEWLADLEARQSTFARLRLAFGCCWATRVIAHEHCAASVAAAASSTGSKTMSAYARDEVSFVSGRTLSFFAIVGLHVVVIYAFATGLAHPLVKAIHDTMTVVPVADPPPHDSPPPPLAEPSLTRNLHVEDPGVVVPPRDDIVEPEIPAGQAPVVVGDRTPVVPPQTKVVHRVGGGPGKGFPNVDDFYPANMIRLDKEGIATVRTCVDDKGRLTAMPTLAESSGTAGLDEAALKVAKAGSGHYRPTTEDGQSVSSCYEYRITFHLKK